MAISRFLHALCGALLGLFFLAGTSVVLAQGNPNPPPAQGGQPAASPAADPTDWVAVFRDPNDPRAPAVRQRCELLANDVLMGLQQMKEGNCEHELLALANTLAEKPVAPVTPAKAMAKAKQGPRKKAATKKAAVILADCGRIPLTDPLDPTCVRIASLEAEIKASWEIFCGANGSGCTVDENNAQQQTLGLIGDLRNRVAALETTVNGHTTQIADHEQRITALEGGGGSGAGLSLYVGGLVTFGSPIYALTIHGDDDFHLVRGSQGYYLEIGPEWTQPTPWGNAMARLSTRIGATNSSDPDTGDEGQVLTLGGQAIGAWLFGAEFQVGPAFVIGSERGGEGADASRFVAFQPGVGGVLRFGSFEGSAFVLYNAASTQALGETITPTNPLGFAIGVGGRL